MNVTFDWRLVRPVLAFLGISGGRGAGVETAAEERGGGADVGTTADAAAAGAAVDATIAGAAAASGSGRGCSGGVCNSGDGIIDTWPAPTAGEVLGGGATVRERSACGTPII